MAYGICDVKECQRKTYMGWRPLTERIGRQVCKRHWDRHKNKNDRFNLFDALGFPESAKLPTENKDFIHQRGAKPEKRPRLCVCGEELQPGHRLCKKCAAERERQRKREYQRKKRVGKAQYLTDDSVIEKDAIRCEGCGKERPPGHTYCEKCAERQKRKSNRERQRKYRKRQRVQND